MDSEVRRIVDGCYERAIELLTENREKLEALAQRLLQEETLDELDAYAAAGIERPRGTATPAPAAPSPNGPAGAPSVERTPTPQEDGDVSLPRGGHASPY